MLLNLGCLDTCKIQHPDSAPGQPRTCGQGPGIGIFLKDPFKRIQCALRLKNHCLRYYMYNWQCSHYEKTPISQQTESHQFLKEEELGLFIGSVKKFLEK